ncbi:hypothetical protein ASC77_25205 [Nocardioides sp. Root1257]|uniref:maleylpyruvate isomerase family mycothiol-dependent enzyme n=1 Tax=unclassified Nocardioides TaxID=2615069 RepID=UPI0006FE0688|nr:MULTISPECIES: maleylpyruvate isomerase family mycothiol-dependent enzyme [unclassified Nocardioides]KQW50958.1 hypothetical protein ASC77_25205 [Nocardioides sp. Root1257]KRC53754.1 hypothetical protein ASE24_24995 [Nocardioides sp. Root224]
MDISERVAVRRQRAADFFDALDDTQLDTPSLCAAWTVREVLGHLVMPLMTPTRTLLWRTLRARGSLDRASAAIAADLARRPRAELTGMLRDRASSATDVPVVGSMGPLTDGCVHLRDCARPLGLPNDAGLDDWRLVLDWLPTRTASQGLVPPHRLDGLSLRATDQDWHWGDGAEVAGPSEALAMAVTGRAAALEDLAGPGLGVLGARMHDA